MPEFDRLFYDFLLALEDLDGLPEVERLMICEMLESARSKLSLTTASFMRAHEQLVSLCGSIEYRQAITSAARLEIVGLLTTITNELEIEMHRRRRVLDPHPVPAIVASTPEYTNGAAK